MIVVWRSFVEDDGDLAAASRLLELQPLSLLNLMTLVVPDDDTLADDDDDDETVEDEDDDEDEIDDPDGNEDRGEPQGPLPSWTTLDLDLDLPPLDRGRSGGPGKRST